ncbi:MAG: metal ABC transporter ATP-binding protein [Clostridia bacterium]|nr:metal ABC transporter ATP-binding protein [Clostridia bacterium]
MDLIQIKKLSFSYPSKKDTLKNINLKIEKGSFTCIVGENGSGKSTLLKCILGLNKGYTGEIKKETHIGYLPQKSEIQSNFPATIEEVVLSGTISNNVRSIFYKKEDKERAKQVMEKLGIYDIRKKCFADLSGGQQQRVLIARALCATKDIIVLDEPTNGLDPSISKQIYELLDKLKNEENITILMVSHDIERALNYADTVIELINGEITFVGKPQDFKLGGAK